MPRPGREWGCSTDHEKGSPRFLSPQAQPGRTRTLPLCRRQEAERKSRIHTGAGGTWEPLPSCLAAHRALLLRNPET